MTENINEQNPQEVDPSPKEKRKVSKSETGHAINVANFEDLESYCIGYGPKYQPTKPTITLAALAAKRLASVAIITSLDNLNSTLTLAINNRENAIEPLSKLSTRIYNGVAASDVSPKFIDDIKTIHHKLQGIRSTPRHPTQEENPNIPEEELIKNISTSQMSFDARIENFNKLIILLSLEPNYNPNEIDLTVAALTAFLNAIKAANTAVINANTNASNARIERNKILYHPETGLVKVANDVKKYVKSVFGATSPQYKQLTHLLFKSGIDLAQVIK